MRKNLRRALRPANLCTIQPKNTSKAKEIKFDSTLTTYEFSKTDENNKRSLKALDIAFRLRGSYASPKEPEIAKQVGVKVLLVGVPRPGQLIPEKSGSTS